MKSASSTFFLLIFCISSVSYTGCSSHKSLVKKDGVFRAPLKCVRYQTPAIMRKSKTGTLLLASAALALPGGSALVVLDDKIGEAGGEKVRGGIPDFGYLVVDKFVEKLNGNGNVLPLVATQEKPIPEEREVPALPGQPEKEKREETCTVIEVKVKKIVYGYVGVFKGTGFLTDAVARLRDPKGDILWQKDYSYFSKDFNRSREIEEYEAEGGKFLREEFNFAADQTASAFFEDIKK